MYKDGNSTNIVAHDQGSVNDPKSDSSDQDRFIEYQFNCISLWRKSGFAYHNLVQSLRIKMVTAPIL